MLGCMYVIPFFSIILTLYFKFSHILLIPSPFKIRHVFTQTLITETYNIITYSFVHIS
jgi:hypothetical protein